MVVGGGPTGLALALQLARLSLPVTLVESRPSPGGLFRGEALMPSGLQALEALDLLPPATEVPQQSLQGWNFWLERRPLFAAEEPLGCARSCTLVDPDGLIRSWTNQLRRLPSARLLLGTAAVGPMVRQGRFAGVRLATGQRLEADLVVACDGRGSPLRRAAGLDLGGKSAPLDVLWFRLRGEAAEALATGLAGRFHTLISGEGSLALFASASGGVQLGWPLRSGERPDLSTADWRERWLQLCPPELAVRLEAVPLEAIEGPLRLPVRVGLARHWWRPGLLLIGDAAHPMSPVRAQGTSMALRDVRVASELLPTALTRPAGVARAQALDGVLAAIEARRAPEIRRIQALQQREWERGERLGASPVLRRLLKGLAPGIGPLLAAVWGYSQRDLRLGVANGAPGEPS